MAHTTTTMTGTLALKEGTAVIKALFRPFDLDLKHPGNGVAYIAFQSDDTCADWDTICENLEDLASDLGVDVPDSEDGTGVIQVLGKHFGASEEAVAAAIDEIDTDGYMSLEVCFTLASLFDDSHGLEGYQCETGWYCSKPRLFEFGGEGAFQSKNVHFTSSSSEALLLGQRVDKALVAGDIEAAAKHMTEAIEQLLRGIVDPEKRSTIQAIVAKALSAS